VALKAKWNNKKICQFLLTALKAWGTMRFPPTALALWHIIYPVAASYHCPYPHYALPVLYI
jgi:hypothetical protein